MSNPIYNISQPNVSAKYDNSTFDIQSGASLNLTGSSDMLVLESGALGATMVGSNNTVMGSNVSHAQVTINNYTSTGNSVVLGSNSSVWDYGTSDSITVGANSVVSVYGVGTTINAKQGGDSIYTWMSNVVNGSNDAIWITNSDNSSPASSSSVNGSNNQVHMLTGNGTLTVTGSNNAISVDAPAFAYQVESVQTSTVSVTESLNGIVLTGAIDPTSVTLNSGVATVQLGNGNVASLNNVASGTSLEYIDASGKANWYVLQDSGAQKLVAAMAVYQPDAPGTGFTPTNSDSPTLQLSAASSVQH
ncbi:hypothetical protein G3N95_01780 [Paraburkholderia sp. Tr-20389]|uniref:hypothetical protein n=1 Tax=Paraburkholderia sp. Tr-20389 TaxID=2703903 RepID=UPI001980E6A0|nr:hypothetical protein [Paraburkholderia sp. Tr-20389]MBN3751651.1 hypothetical protein [Paraburkholderia sp. Tr-20389]